MMSMRRYLLVGLLAIVSATLLLTGWLSYRQAVIEVEELFDAQLAQSARVLVATLSTRPLLPGGTENDTVVFPVWHSPVSAVDDDVRDVAAAGHKYESRLVFQLWEGAGERLLMRSENAPLRPLATFADGYAETALDGERFQVFSLARDGLWLQVAQDDYMRAELAEDIALADIWPHLAGIPLMAILILLVVTRGLRPLAMLRRAIAGRDADNLQPVRVSPASEELQPIMDELNGLLTRLGESFAREKRFTSDAAHELRTPLAVLRIHAENALAAGGDAERREALGMLLRGVERASRLVEQLLTLARVEPGDVERAFRPVRLAALVREELAALVPVATRRGQELDFAADGEYEVLGDAALLGILVRNLVDNALRYSPTDSLVQVRLSRKGEARAELQVIDEGPGVEPAQVMRVFDRFYRGETGRGDGAGLGLAIVGRIVALHGGQVEARPRTPGHAGCFVVTLAAKAVGHTVVAGSSV